MKTVSTIPSEVQFLLDGLRVACREYKSEEAISEKQEIKTFTKELGLLHRKTDKARYEQSASKIFDFIIFELVDDLLKLFQSTRITDAINTHRALEKEGIHEALSYLDDTHGVPHIYTNDKLYLKAKLFELFLTLLDEYGDQSLEKYLKDKRTGITPRAKALLDIFINGGLAKNTRIHIDNITYGLIKIYLSLNSNKQRLSAIQQYIIDFENSLTEEKQKQALLSKAADTMKSYKDYYQQCIATYDQVKNCTTATLLKQLSTEQIDKQELLQIKEEPQHIIDADLSTKQETENTDQIKIQADFPKQEQYPETQNALQTTTQNDARDLILTINNATQLNSTSKIDEREDIALSEPVLVSKADEPIVIRPAM